MKKKIIVAIISISVLVLLAGCGNTKEEPVSNEVAALGQEIDENTPDPTTTPNKEPVVTKAPIVTQTPEVTPEVTASPTATPEASNTEKTNVEATTTSKPTTNENLTNPTSSTGSSAWDQLSPEEKAAIQQAAMQQEIDNLMAQANAGTGNNSSSSSAGSGSSAGSNTGLTGNTASNENTGSTNNSRSNTDNNTGNATTPSAPAVPEQPSQSAQHTHSYTWVESGNTRVMTCSCGETTGTAEDKIADGVWGYWGDASSLLTAVNNQRAYGERYTVSDELGNIIGVVEGLPGLDNSLSASAQSLAIHAAQTNSYYGQGIHAGGSAQDAVSSWVGTGLMSNEKTTSGGVACLNKSNGDGTYTTIWVLVVG